MFHRLQRTRNHSKRITMIYLLSLLILILVAYSGYKVIKALIESGWPDLPVSRERKIISQKQSKIIELYGYVPKAVKK